MAGWLERMSQWHEMYCHDQKVMGSNAGWVNLGARSTSAQVVLLKNQISVWIILQNKFWAPLFIS